MAKEFSYEVRSGQQIFDDPAAKQKFLSKKPDGFRGFENHRKPRQAKSNPQLGYYWGLLVPKITEQLKELGWTKTFNAGTHSVESYYTDKDTHEWLKAFCSKLGDDGVEVTLSEQDQEICSMYITNVLWVAEHWLEMDREKLEAKKPKI